MKQFIFLILLAILNLFSCSTKIELDIPEAPPQIVVNSLITNDSLITVNVCKTVAMLNQGTNCVTNAEIELWVNDNFIENLQQKEDGIYESETTAQIGVNYQIYVDVPNFDRMISSAIIPAPINITQATYIANSYYDQGQVSLASEVKISFYDPPEITNYYQISFYSYRYTEYELNSLTVLDSTISIYYGLYYLNSNDPIIINEGDLQYHIGASRIRSLIFSDELMNEETSITFLAQIATGNYAVPIVALKSISHEYYMFQKSLIRHTFNQGMGSVDATNMFLVSNPNDLYSNIQNGLGIFAGYSESHFELEEIEQ